MDTVALTNQSKQLGGRVKRRKQHEWQSDGHGHGECETCGLTEVEHAILEWADWSDGRFGGVPTRPVTPPLRKLWDIAEGLRERVGR